jgi:hypothetical protein
MTRESTMTTIKLQKRPFSANVMNRIWDLSDGEYQTIIRQQQAIEAKKNTGDDEKRAQKSPASKQAK